ncbi:short-chain dehydrogenase/reductase family 9C member 7-like [Periplaneta americana]|uniref:short-chain dehydrogenase/reductase family 9C member 7-like n=1 Tax=Periplaneta americana TaxID=6978 RepID=UPI0037E79FCE
MYVFDNLLKKVVVFASLLIFLNFFVWNNLVFNFVLVVTAFCLTDFVFHVVWHFVTKEMLPDLNDKAVFITGCDSGFGHKLAMKLDKLGVTVFAGCLFPEGDGASQLKKSCSDRLNIIQLDVMKQEHVDKAAEIVTSTLQNRSEKLWAVVNNAGIASGSEVEWTPMEEYDRIIGVNATGPAMVTKAFLPLLRKSKGRVVIVTSILGRTTFPGLSAYCMSKYAAVALSNALRREVLKWSISVHTIQPWFYSTNITDGKTVARDIKRNWDKAPQSVRDDYEEGYINKYMKLGSRTMELISRPESAVYEVVDALAHAAIGKNPKLHYVPGIIGYIQTKICAAMSDEVVDMLSLIAEKIPADKKT